MNFFDMFNKIDTVQPLTDNKYDSSSYEPTYVDNAFTTWETEFTGIKSQPTFYNLDGYISPYASNNWGATSSILQTIVDESRLPALSDKINPDRIFNADTAALRTLAADQVKVTKVFEKRLLESLNDRGKFGLTENDIMAMQALTSARSSVASINKEQIAIKKNIADLKIKQQSSRNSSSSGSSNSGSGYGGRAPSSMNVGRSILDSIFDVPTMPTQPNVSGYASANSNSAGDILDELVGGNTMSEHIQHEAVKPTTYVCVGQNDDDVEFRTYDSDGNLIANYPNPNTNITKIDRNSNTAIDELLVQYPIKYV